MRHLLSIALVLSLIPQGRATTLARGIGSTETCAHYLVEVANRSDAGNSLQQWALGFVTGYMAGQLEDDPTSKMDNTEVLRSLQTYCGNNPSSRLVDALTVFSYAASIANKKYNSKPAK